MTPSDRFAKAIAAFDAYHLNDPNQEKVNGQVFPKELLYARRMTEKLAGFAPDADDSIKLAARCQHIGRWEIPRSNYPMNKKGYLQWRNEEKSHHAKIAEDILATCTYDQETIDRVKFLLLKKELYTHPETQLLEDVVCLVFIEYYLEDFAAKHEDEKVVDILRKTIRKMTPTGVKSAGQILVSARMKSLIGRALSVPQFFEFEKDFMEDNIRCIPMTVRFKLDASGIKLKLSEWNQLTLSERTCLAELPTATMEEVSNYRKYLQPLVLTRTGKGTTEQGIDNNPAWAMMDNIHESLQHKLIEYHWSISLEQWRSLSDLQRFVLIKLSRPNHENKNFPKAMKEFGLTG
jgi:hypothetical protein